MNAMLTWWGVSIAILNHQSQGNAVVSNETLLKVVPVFVAVMVWLIRVLIIGTISVAGDRFFSQVDQRAQTSPRATGPARTFGLPGSLLPGKAQTGGSAPFKPSPKSASATENGYARTEPTYHPLSTGTRPPNSSTPHAKS
jgi:hypothetical protein